MPAPASLSHWQHFGACRNCGYALRNLPQPVCPECGQTFDPNDPKTMFVSSWVNWLDRLLLCAPGWLSHAFCAIPLALAIAASADIVPNRDVFLWSAGLVAVVIPYWFCRLIAWFALTGYYGTEHAKRKSWWGWAVAPACCAATVAVWISEM